MHIEVTDTFGGEANYSWVRRYSADVPDNLSDIAIVRRAKAAAGWSGMRCRTDNFGDTIALYPYGVCNVLFITFDHESVASKLAPQS